MTIFAQCDENHSSSGNPLQIKPHFNCYNLLIFLASLTLNACGEPGAIFLTEEEDSNNKSFNFPLHMNEAKCNKCHGLETKVSKTGELRSHNVGKDCITCHSLNGAGRGIYKVAGSVFKPDGETPYPNIKVKLFPGKNRLGNPVAVLEVDGNGNFYTTKEIMPGGKGDGEIGLLYPSVVTDHGEYSMPVAFSISMGGCNSCHGVNVARIFAE